VTSSYRFSIERIEKHSRSKQKKYKRRYCSWIFDLWRKSWCCGGITNGLTKKYDAVELVKIASEVLGGKGGGGRKDFAQAGGTNKDKIEEAFKTLSKKIS